MHDLRQQLRTFVRTDTARLMFTYIAIIMAMSVAFSIVLYITSANQLERQRPPDQFIGNGGITVIPSPGIREFLDHRIHEGHVQLAWRLVFINIATLIIGAIASYYLARQNLEPIEAAMRAQTQFVSDASHELRTPLTSLRASSEVALHKKRLTLTDAKEVIQSNIEDAVRLQNLTDALLGLLKETDTKAAFATVEIQDIISDSLNTVAPIALEKDIAIHDDVHPLHIFTDRAILQQLLTILLENAIKYSDKGSDITVSATVSSKHLHLSVADQGIGISQEDAPHIFTRFYRADKSRSTRQGYGIGLAIAQKLVQSLGGKITLESELSKGSTFTIIIPHKPTLI